MKQADVGLSLATNRTRRREFLAQMEHAVPWAALVHLVARQAPGGPQGASAVLGGDIAADSLQPAVAHAERPGDGRSAPRMRLPLENRVRSPVFKRQLSAAPPASVAHIASGSHSPKSNVVVHGCRTRSSPSLPAGLARGWRTIGDGRRPSSDAATGSLWARCPSSRPCGSSNCGSPRP